MFSLEVLQAYEGDCLLLHFGTDQPKLMLIDGGPSGIYDNFLKPRLQEIRVNQGLDTLKISLVMVSHIDDDHANGICRLTDDLVAREADAPFSIDHLWVNTFDDIVGNRQLPKISSISAGSSAANLSALSIPELHGADEHVVAVIASTSQGRQLRDNAKSLSTPVNFPFKKLGGTVLVRGDSPQSVINWDGLAITVLTPNEKRLEKLQKKWDEDLKTAAEKGDESVLFASLTSMDTSPFNLSSIACLIEMAGKHILLTGDARSDDILEGIKAAGLLDNNGVLEVDILKMPHHGSIRNMRKDFLDVVRAKHYVISANGSDNNPDHALLDLLIDTISKGTIYLTNRKGKKTIEADVKDFLHRIRMTGSALKVQILPESSASFFIHLDGEKPDF